MTKETSLNLILFKHSRRHIHEYKKLFWQRAKFSAYKIFRINILMIIFRIVTFLVIRQNNYSLKTLLNLINSLSHADYLWIQYSSELDKTAFCTITYSKTDKKLYVFRQEMSDETLNQAKQDLKSSDSAKVNQAQAVLSSCTKYVDASSKKGTVLANNVKSFQLQVNPADNSVAVIIGFEDTKTKETYKVTSVVGLRNSFVLKKHEWD